MKIKVQLLVLVWMMLAHSGLMAANPPDSTYRAMRDTTAFKMKLKNFSSTFTGMECQFTQLKKMKMLRKPVVSHGLFCYRGGKQVRWEYDDPFIYIIVINNDKIYIRDEKKTNEYDLTANKSFMAMNGKLSAMVDGSLLDNHSEFRIKYFENDQLYKVDLTPLKKDMKSYFSLITLTFDKSDFSVSGIIMAEKGGDVTEIHFYNKKINKPISDERFIIK